MLEVQPLPAAHVVLLDQPVLIVEVLDHTVDEEEGDHLLVTTNFQRVHVAGRLPHIASLFSDPVVLEVAPTSLQDVTMDGPTGMQVPRDVAPGGNTDQIDPHAGGGGVVERLEGQALSVGNPRKIARRDGKVGEVCRKWLSVEVRRCGHSAADGIPYRPDT